MKGHKQQRKATGRYMNTSERNALMKLSDAAPILYMHYISKSGAPDYDYRDATVARTLPWAESKIARVRKQLQAGGWYRRVDYPKAACGSKTTHHYLGQEAVSNSHRAVEQLSLPQDTEERPAPTLFPAGN